MKVNVYLNVQVPKAVFAADSWSALTPNAARLLLDAYRTAHSCFTKDESWLVPFRVLRRNLTFPLSSSAFSRARRELVATGFLRPYRQNGRHIRPFYTLVHPPEMEVADAG